MEGKLVGIVFGILFIVGMVQAFHFYSTVNYQADVARGYIEGVLSTNNINDMKTYLQKGLQQLNDYNYNGAPVMFATPYQNFDLIKVDIQKQINGLDEYQRTYTTTSDKSYAYQQTINNAKTNAETLSDRIAEIGGGRGVTPSQNPVGYIILVIGIFAIIPIHLTTQWYENREFARKYETPSRF